VTGALSLAETAGTDSRKLNWLCQPSKFPAQPWIFSSQPPGGGIYPVAVNYFKTQMAKSVYSGVTASVGAVNIPAATVALVPCSIKMNEPVKWFVV